MAQKETKQNKTKNKKKQKKQLSLDTVDKLITYA